MRAPAFGVFLVGLLGAQASFESPKEVFRRAETLYQEEKFQEAIEVYEGVRAQGIEDGVLYYNLGSAYFKAGQLGRAILSYERAHRLLPGDDNVRANLEFANELIADEVAAPSFPPIVDWLVGLYRLVSPDTLAVGLSLAFILGGVALSLLLSGQWPDRRRLVVWMLVASGLVAVLSGGALAVKLGQASDNVEAVILTTNAYVRSGPGASNPQLAEVHEGIKVRVLAERDDWYQVALPNGLTGWMEKAQLEVI